MACNRDIFTFYLAVCKRRELRNAHRILAAIPGKKDVDLDAH
jgi:hypothetical protein